IIVGTGWWAYGISRRQWARYEGIPRVRALADKGDFVGAYRLALDVEADIRNDPAFSHLWPEVSQLISVRSDPPGAAVLWKPYAQIKASWMNLGSPLLNQARIPAGPVRIQLRMPAYEPVEVAADKISPRELQTSSYEFRLNRLGSPGSRMIRVPSDTRVSTA